MSNVVVPIPVYVGAGVPVGEGAVTVKVATIVPGFIPIWSADRATVGVVAVTTVPFTRVMLQLYDVIGQFWYGGTMFVPATEPEPSTVNA